MLLTCQEIVSKVEELRELMGLASGELQQELLDKYAVHIWALAVAGDRCVLEQMLEIQTRLDDLSEKFPNLTDVEVEESLLLCAVLNILRRSPQVDRAGIDK